MRAIITDDPGELARLQGRMAILTRHREAGDEELAAARRMYAAARLRQTIESVLSTVDLNQGQRAELARLLSGARPEVTSR